MSPCPRCGHQNPNHASFCGKCGQPLPTSKKQGVPFIGLFVIGILLGSGLLMGIERWITGDWLFPAYSTPTPAFIVLAPPTASLITPTVLPTAAPTNPPVNTSPPEVSSLPTILPTPTSTAVTTIEIPSPTPAWQYPDGLIAYACNEVIYLFDPAIGRETLLSNQPLNSLVPAFSPTLPLLAYRSNASGTWQIYVSTLDGVERQQLTSSPVDNNYEAVWSPDGQRMAFVSDRTGSKQIFVMDSDGNNQIQLTSNNAYNDDPTWSGGNKIAFESDISGRFSIYIIEPDGSRLQELIRLGNSSSTPAWSPDGMWLAFEVQQGGSRHVWIADNSGGQARQITTLGSENQRPAWSPDGSRLVLHSNYDQARSNRFDVWAIEIATGEMQRFTWRGDCFNPAWSR